MSRIVVSLPSSNFDAASAFRNAVDAASRAGVSDSALVVAPRFLKVGVTEVRDPALVFWEVDPFWGSSKAVTDLGTRALRLSAHEVLDLLLRYLTATDRFPNLNTIVVVGHSAGGQMVQRYAMTSVFDPPDGVTLRFVPMNPSSYAYLDPRRFDGGVFRVPPPDVVRACPRYDAWGYGLSDLYAVHRKRNLDAAALRSRYAGQSVTVLAGTADTRRGRGLSDTCAANLQGDHRLDRARTFQRHVLELLGTIAGERHLLVEVPGVGHSGRAMLQSEVARRVVFGEP